MVPGLYRREQQRQAEFYKQHGLSNTYLAKVEDNVRFICPDELMRLGLFSFKCIYHTCTCYLFFKFFKFIEFLKYLISIVW